jgi:hypothetical protein
MDALFQEKFTSNWGNDKYILPDFQIQSASSSQMFGTTSTEKRSSCLENSLDMPLPSDPYNKPYSPGTIIHGTISDNIRPLFFNLSRKERSEKFDDYFNTSGEPNSLSTCFYVKEQINFPYGKSYYIFACQYKPLRSIPDAPYIPHSHYTPFTIGFSGNLNIMNKRLEKVKKENKYRRQEEFGDIKYRLCMAIIESKGNLDSACANILSNVSEFISNRNKSNTEKAVRSLVKVYLNAYVSGTGYLLDALLSLLEINAILEQRINESNKKSYFNIYRDFGMSAEEAETKAMVDVLDDQTSRSVAFGLSSISYR